jgi:hypothetical protein
MKRILPWFFVASVAGLLVLLAPSARAQSASDSISQGPQAGQENSDKGTSTEGFPPLPEVGQSEPGAGADGGVKQGESSEDLRDFDEPQSGQNDAGPNNASPDAGGSDLSAPQ